MKSLLMKNLHNNYNNTIIDNNKISTAQSYLADLGYFNISYVCN